jgi:hypothetical protein
MKLELISHPGAVVRRPRTCVAVLLVALNGFTSACEGGIDAPDFDVFPEQYGDAPSAAASPDAGSLAVADQAATPTRVREDEQSLRHEQESRDVRRDSHHYPAMSLTRRTSHVSARPGPASGTEPPGGSRTVTSRSLRNVEAREP